MRVTTKQLNDLIFKPIESAPSKRWKVLNCSASALIFIFTFGIMPLVVHKKFKAKLLQNQVVSSKVSSGSFQKFTKPRPKRKEKEEIPPPKDSSSSKPSKHSSSPAQSSSEKEEIPPAKVSNSSKSSKHSSSSSQSSSESEKEKEASIELKASLSGPIPQEVATDEKEVVQDPIENKVEKTAAEERLDALLKAAEKLRLQEAADKEAQLQKPKAQEATLQKTVEDEAALQKAAQLEARKKQAAERAAAFEKALERKKEQAAKVE